MTKYQEAIEALTSQGKFYINLGLERVQNVLELLNNPQDKLKIIHVAGTNGKGSVCSMLSSILTAANIKTGLFTSPHVFEYTERIKINDIEISKEDFANLIINIINLAEKNDIHLTEFEILTVAAFKYFNDNNAQVIILETGLGGRLDATNVIKENICSIITHIDLDHTERLGETIEQIAFEKAGIIKQNCPLIIGKNTSGINVVEQKANEVKSNIIYSENYEKIDLSNCNLKGTYQKENVSLAIKTTELLNKNGFNITKEQINTGLNKVKHPCRFQYVKEKNLIIDGAHNPDGALALRKSLDYYYPNKKIKFIFGCLKNKEYSKMMQTLFTPNDDIYFYEFQNQNACNIQELTSICPYPTKPFNEYKEDKSTLTVICGSFYMIKEVLQKLA